MIKNIKIHNIFYIIKISKSIKPNKCTHLKNYENLYLSVFFNFKSSMSPIKSRCDVPSGTTQQGGACPILKTSNCIE